MIVLLHLILGLAACVGLNGHAVSRQHASAWLPLCQFVPHFVEQLPSSRTASEKHESANPRAQKLKGAKNKTPGAVTPSAPPAKRKPLYHQLS